MAKWPRKFWRETWEFALQNVYTTRKDCFQNKSKFISEDQFTKHLNITIH